MHDKVVAPPAVEASPNTHASPLNYSALLTSADFVLDDTVGPNAHGNPTLLPVEGGGEATGTVNPEADVNSVGGEEEGEEEEEEGDDNDITN
jgi:hypothetical protein